MGWFPIVVEDSLSESLTDAFYSDLSQMLQEDVGIDCFWEINPEDIEDIKYAAFNRDHMEHVASWLYDERVWPLFKKHGITGKYVLYHTDAGGYYEGIAFIEGEPFNVEVVLDTKIGDPLGK